ncbi:hypothetical protein SKAU_G00419650 [Synaphobranchus kaupii]|uniref:ornithine decarboxylase n=1 Tax=Synaphobranchus kaupii TaxID=118154 RepID=A0A9Q1E6D4_SYNKA|nr:hypothetical protein SKAU_G00419650 [Synaphobranchus kaupii]
MNTFTPADFDFTFLEEGFCARDMVEQRINELSMSDDRDAFYVADLGDVLKKHLRWVRAMPRVTPFYAVKCNDSRAVVMTLASLGTGFDCASKTEIQLVQSLGVDPSRIIYANPCKQMSQIKYASAHGVQMMTFDSEVELVKVARCHENSKPAGCSWSAHGSLGLDIIGVSFHVGSGCTDPETYTQAISDARCVFDMGLGYNMTLLDIGGGFPGSDDTKLKFEEITAVINPALDKYFPADSGVRVIAEPGRYYVCSAYTLAVNIIAKKVVMKEQSASDDEDDGANDRTLIAVHPAPTCSWVNGCSSTTWGPTLSPASSTFNGFQKPDIHYVMSRSNAFQQISAQGLPAPVEEACPSGMPSCCGRESSLELPAKPCPARVL